MKIIVPLVCILFVQSVFAAATGYGPPEAGDKESRTVRVPRHQSSGQMAPDRQRKDSAPVKNPDEDASTLPARENDEASGDAGDSELGGEGEWYRVADVEAQLESYFGSNDSSDWTRPMLSAESESERIKVLLGSPSEKKRNKNTNSSPAGEKRKGSDDNSDREESGGNDYVHYESLKSKWLELTPDVKRERVENALMAIGLASAGYVATSTRALIHVRRLMMPFFALVFSAGLNAADSIEYQTANIERIDRTLDSFENFEYQITNPEYGEQMRFFFESLGKTL